VRAHALKFFGVSVFVCVPVCEVLLVCTAIKTEYHGERTQTPLVAAAVQITGGSLTTTTSQQRNYTCYRSRWPS
jgi:hypothetical protein